MHVIVHVCIHMCIYTHSYSSKDVQTQRVRTVTAFIYRLYIYPQVYIIYDLSTYIIIYHRWNLTGKLTRISLLILLSGCESSDELCKVSISIDELSVGPSLSDPPSVHHYDLVTLREEPYPMGHQEARLREEGEGGGGGDSKRREEGGEEEEETVKGEKREEEEETVKGRGGGGGDSKRGEEGGEKEEETVKGEKREGRRRRRQ